MAKKGDYVLATKYSDGDPCDHWCVGFYENPMDYGDTVRHNVVDSKGSPFRGNGFRRVQKITPLEGSFLLGIERLTLSGMSVWKHLRAFRKEMKAMKL